MAINIKSLAAVALAGLSFSGWALDGKPARDLPTASVFSARLLPDRPGLVSWKTLAGVQTVKEGPKIVPQFSKEILALDRQRVQIQGFVLALDIGERNRHFLITAVPPHCQYCLPAGPDAIVEVFAKEPIRYSIEPIVVGGKLAVLRNDPSGVLYRLTEAEPAVISEK